METVYKITIHKNVVSALVCLIGMIFTTIFDIVETSSAGTRIVYDLMQLVGFILVLYYLWILWKLEVEDVVIFKVKRWRG